MLSPGTGADYVAIRVQEAASLRLDEIYHYTRARWGAEHADRYITDLFAAFEQIESHSAVNGGVKLGHGAAQNWATLGLRGTRVMSGGQSAALSM